MTRTSEFWVAIGTGVLGAVGGVLAQYKMVSADQWTVIQGFLISGVTYVIGRITSKFVKKV